MMISKYDQEEDTKTIIQLIVDMMFEVMDDRQQTLETLKSLCEYERALIELRELKK